MLYDTIIIGGGQAGLAAGYYLKKKGRSFTILERANEVGSPWRSRYDSLVLFTPSEYSSLPGLPNFLNKKIAPSKDQMADYLKKYASYFEFPLQLDCHVRELRKEKDLFHLESTAGLFSSKNVIIATGPFQHPYIPEIASTLSSSVYQIHSAYYKNHIQIPQGNVLVVGGGNSGAQIAVELSRYNPVSLSVRRKINFRSLKLLGASIFWWGTWTGVFTSSKTSWVGKYLKKKGDFVYSEELKDLIKQKVIPVFPAIRSFSGNEVQFTDGQKLIVSSILWATGFKEDFTWIKIPELFDRDRQLQHHEGITSVKGLYFVGLSWQRSRRSALVFGVGRDAEFVVGQMM